MGQYYSIDGVIPVVHPTAYVHPSAVLIGDVIVGPRVYIGPLASLRGDFGRLVLKEGANLQDTCVMHGRPHSDTVVEVDGHIGHGAILHGCTIGENVLVGMNAVVMDDAVIGDSSIIAAAAFVKTGMQVPAKSLVMGAPAKIVKTLSDDAIAQKSRATRLYQQLAVRSMNTMQPVEPLAEVEPDRKRIPRSTIEPATADSK